MKAGVSMCGFFWKISVVLVSAVLLCVPVFGRVPKGRQNSEQAGGWPKKRKMPLWA